MNIEPKGLVFQYRCSHQPFVIFSLFVFESIFVQCGVHASLKYFYLVWLFFCMVGLSMVGTWSHYCMIFSMSVPIFFFQSHFCICIIIFWFTIFSACIETKGWIMKKESIFVFTHSPIVSHFIVNLVCFSFCVAFLFPLNYPIDMHFLAEFKI